MDNLIRIEQMKNMVKKFCDDRDWGKYHSAKDIAIGIITEAGELLEHFRFKSPEETEHIMGNGITREKVCQELCDVLYFILSFSVKYNIDISTEFEKKLRINDSKYPVDKALGSNKKYSEFDG